MTRHYVLTRSAYAADYPLAANVRRLEMLQFVTAPALLAQTTNRWNWLVRCDRSDPLLRLRQAAILAVKPAARFVFRSDTWASAIRWGETVLQMRLDDDDALAPDHLERVRRAADQAPGERVAWMLPVGWKVNGDQAERWVRPRNQFVTLQTPAGDDGATVYDVEHPAIAKLAPIRVVDEDPAWAWFRHPDVLGGHRSAAGDLGPVRELLPTIDWRLVARRAA